MADIKHPLVQDGWFHERNDQWPGSAMSLQIKRTLHHEQSNFQDVLVFESVKHGNVLVLDGAIQCTEHDEFSYQEMITHLAMMSHPDPRRVLVIGGGDGGVLREIFKHKSVERADLCDIDEAVPRLSRQFLPHMAAGLDHPNATVTIGDGIEFVASKKNEYDVIITDSSDPEGPAHALFEKPYYQSCYDALREGGVITTQAESFWNNRDLIKKIKRACKEVFSHVEWAWTSVPTYPSGMIGFLVASKDPSRDVRKPMRSWSRDEENKLCRYYNAETHSASFILPTFAREIQEA